MYMCLCAFKHLFSHEPALNSTQLAFPLTLPPVPQSLPDPLVQGEPPRLSVPLPKGAGEAVFILHREDLSHGDDGGGPVVQEDVAVKSTNKMTLILNCANSLVIKFIARNTHFNGFYKKKMWANFYCQSHSERLFIGIGK